MRARARTRLTILASLLLAASVLASGAAARDETFPSGRQLDAGLHPLRRIKPPIEDWLIPFGPQRRRQMAAYSKRHYGRGEWRLRRVELVVEHMAVAPSVRAVYDTFAANAPDVEFGELPGVCSHYVVGSSGRIFRLVPLSIRCRHVVGLNHLSVGIEHVGSTPADVLGNPRQLRASLRLSRWLRCRFGLGVGRTIGHAESLGSPFYRELVPALRGRTHGDWRPGWMRQYRARLRRSDCP